VWQRADLDLPIGGAVVAKKYSHCARCGRAFDSAQQYMYEGDTAVCRDRAACAQRVGLALAGAASASVPVPALASAPGQVEVDLAEVTRAWARALRRITEGGQEKQGRS
jgi:hypothetical protein